MLIVFSYSHNNVSRSYAVEPSTSRVTRNLPLMRNLREHHKTVLRDDDQAHEFVIHRYIPFHCTSSLTISCHSSVATTANINPHRRALPNELLYMIVDHLRNDTKSLARLLRVCKKWFVLLGPRLWIHGDPLYLQASFVRSHKRRNLYASFLRSIHFWSHEKFWN